MLARVIAHRCLAEFADPPHGFRRSAGCNIDVYSIRFLTMHIIKKDHLPTVLVTCHFASIIRAKPCQDIFTLRFEP